MREQLVQLRCLTYDEMEYGSDSLSREPVTVMNDQQH